ncbi:MAG TPA: ABC transporter substrate-binding protein, partial [Candidatus Udaeobacter sp.]|nr:ABC transporter substrate-binding protein [Candidatus Udaeobacter sp.]
RRSRRLRSAHPLVPAWITALVVVVAVAAVAGCGGGNQPTAILVGSYLGLTGHSATFGQSTQNGIVMAFDEVNAAGGIAGKTLKAIIEDDQGRPEEAATAVRKLISQDGVIAVLGDVPSSNSLAAAPICQEAHVPMITPSSTNPRVTETGDYIFRVCFIDPFQGTVMAKFAAEHKGLKKAGILRDVRSDYSVGLADFFIATFKELGGTIVADEAYSQGDTDFRAQLTTLKAAGPDAIFVPGYYNDVGLVVRQAREIGLTIPILGGDGWDSPELLALGGPALANTFFSNHYSTEDQSPTVQNFIQAYEKRFGAKPDALAALGYDAAQCLAAALREIATADPAQFVRLVGPVPSDAAAREARTAARERLRSVLAATKDLRGVTGSITMDSHRNAVKPAVVLAVSQEGYRYVTTIEP